MQHQATRRTHASDVLSGVPSFGSGYFSCSTTSRLSVLHQRKADVEGSMVQLPARPCNSWCIRKCSRAQQSSSAAGHSSCKATIQCDTDLDVLDDVGGLANVLVRLVVVDHRDQRLARWVHISQAAGTSRLNVRAVSKHLAGMAAAVRGMHGCCSDDMNYGYHSKD